MKTYQRHTLTFLFLLLLAMIFLRPSIAYSQQATTTPLPVDLAPLVPTVTSAPGTSQAQVFVTPTATIETRALLEARDFANVRAQPDTSAVQLGQIQSGEQYAVVGQYFQWYQFEFPASPTGLGWVFGELVTLTGEIGTIPEVLVDSEPTVDVLVLQATGTSAAITQTPGGILTATANARFNALGQSVQITQPGSLPTFTYPPNVNAPGNVTEEATVSADMQEAPVNTVASSTGLPPIIPILMLGGLGMAGLAISAFRKP